MTAKVGASNGTKTNELSDFVEEKEKINYSLFKRWFEERPLTNPRVGITSCLVRQIAILVYDDYAERLHGLKEEIRDCVEFASNSDYTKCFGCRPLMEKDFIWTKDSTDTFYRRDDVLSALMGFRVDVCENIQFNSNTDYMDFLMKFKKWFQLKDGSE